MKLWEEIESAEKRIRSAILRTPMVYSDTFSKWTGKEVFLKLENLQKAGSFKIRGAYNKLSRLSPPMKKRGVVAASEETMPRGLPSLPPSWNPIDHRDARGCLLAKQMATRSYGGEVILFGQNTDEALGYAKKLAKRENLYSSL